MPEESKIPSSVDIVRYTKDRAKLRGIDVSFLNKSEYQELIKDVKTYMDSMFQTAFMAGENKGIETTIKTIRLKP